MSAKTADPIDDILLEIFSPKDKPKEKEDLSKIPSRTPPKRGLCRRCGKNKPINRLMLCYPCWVKTNLEKFGWKDGAPHPDWCACEVAGGHQRSSGN